MAHLKDAAGTVDVLLGDRRFASQAACSYFALANDHWQLLGLDSSYSDPDKPDLEAPQSEWLAQRVAGGVPERGTILLSHHQPFSGFEDVDPRLANTVTAALGGHYPVSSTSGLGPASSMRFAEIADLLEPGPRP